MKRQSIPFVTATAVGALYGLTLQVAPRAPSLKDLYGVMSFGYVFILPVIMGALVVSCADERLQRSWWFRIAGPWPAVTFCLIVSILVGWEGAICLIMAIVIMIPLASLGGLVAGIVLTRIDRSKLHASVLIPLLFSPLASAYLESYLNLPVVYRTAETAIDIAAPASVVWSNIIRVPRITEPVDGLFYKMGFPRPIEATLSHEGVGGVRQASFEGGLVFIETISKWEPEKLLTFSIEADPSAIPVTTLDEHVVVGGRYFDVLEGSYRIEKLSDEKTRLHLSSSFRVSTRFNFYAGWWAKLLMTDVQESILGVLKTRCERLDSQLR